MVGTKLLSATDIAKELNTGHATIKYILNRFEEHLPHEFKNGQTLYPQESLKTSMQIIEKINMGVLPSDIEKNLSESNTLEIPEELKLPDELSSLLPNEEIKLGTGGLKVLKKVFKEIGDQQKRIAKAHEDRAEAEQRKAVAIEKRAAAEKQKAEAMNNIANALQEMNKLRAGDLTSQQIAHQAATIIASDEIDSMEELDDEIDDIQDISTTEESIIEGIEPDDILPDELVKAVSEDSSTDLSDTDAETYDSVESGDNAQDAPDDLSLLIDELSDGEAIDDISDDMDDLVSLLDESEKPDSSNKEAETVPPSDEQETDIDNLYDLLEDPPRQAASDQPATDDSDDNKAVDEKPSTDHDDMDDLSLLIDGDSATKETIQPDTAPSDLDDLSALVDKETDSTTENDLDDLSALIDQNDDKNLKEIVDVEIDDLSKLISDPSDEKTSDDSEPEMDDLSALIDTEEKPVSDDATEDTHQPDSLDDLSKLIDSSETTEKTDQKEQDQAPAKDKEVQDSEETISIDFSPKDDLKGYKAAVMKLILGFKEKGMTVDQATEKLNANKIETLSGKPEWSQKAISQIYKFIESAK